MKKLIIVLVLVLLIPSVTALGVAPAKLDLQFKPGSEQTLTFTIINNNQRNMTVSIGADGELAEYINPRQSTITLTAGEREKTSQVEINMPSNLEPGPHTGRLLISEKPASGSGVSAVVTVASRITIMSPYPGKYIQPTIIKTFFQPNKQGNFIIEAESLGQEDIDTARATIEILENGQAIETLTSGMKKIPSQESVYFNLPWTPESSGTYLARATVEYDREAKTVERGFIVGERELTILGITGEDFELGEELSLNLLLKNDWNQELSEAYAELEFIKDGNSFGGSPTEVTSFEPFEEKALRAVWDTSQAELGEYTLAIRLNYLDKTVEKTYKATLTEDGLFIKGLKTRILTPQAPPILLSVIITLITAILAWFIITYSRKEH